MVFGERRTERFRIVYTERAAGAAEEMAETIEETRAHFQEVLGRDWPGVTEIRIGVGREEMAALALPGGEPPSWAVAIAYPSHNIVLVEARSLTAPDGANTLRHELSHVALGRLAPTWPRWFQEGLAMYLTGEQRFSFARYATLFRAVQQDRVLDFDDLTTAWPDHPDDVEIAYAQSVAFVEFLVERHGRKALRAFIDDVAGGSELETAFARAFKATLLIEEGAWRTELPDRYGWWPVVTMGSSLWVLAAAICVAGYLRRRAVVARRRAEMEAEQAAQEAAWRILEAEERAVPGPGSRLGPLAMEDSGDWGNDDGNDPPKAKPTLH